MDALFATGLNFCFPSGLLTCAGAETVHDTTVAITSWAHSSAKAASVPDFIKNALIRGPKCLKSCAKATLSWRSRTASISAAQSTSFLLSALPLLKLCFRLLP